MAVELINDDQFASILAAEEKVVVKFFASWCGSCRLFAPKYKRLSEDERFKHIRFLDVDAEKNPQIRNQVGVNTLPYFAVFKNGELVEGVSTSKEEAFVELLSKI